MNKQYASIDAEIAFGNFRFQLSNIYFSIADRNSVSVCVCVCCLHMTAHAPELENCIRYIYIRVYGKWCWLLLIVCTDCLGYLNFSFHSSVSVQSFIHAVLFWETMQQLNE